MSPDSTTRTRHLRGHWNMENTKKWVELFEKERIPAVQIAARVGADPQTVSAWLKKHGVEVYSGLHRIERVPPSLSLELIQLLNKGPEEVVKFLEDRVWGMTASDEGLSQLTKFCKFVGTPLGTSVQDVAIELSVHRSTVLAWTKGIDQPYLVRAATTALQTEVRPGWKLLSLRLESGGNLQGPWIQVPMAIRNYQDVTSVVAQLVPLEETFVRAASFGIPRKQIDTMREDLFAYLLAIMAGDAGKTGGEQERFDSSSIDLQLTLKQPTNERLGNFVCMCANSLGLVMDRKADKQPSGSTRMGRQPSAAYRWTSKRSPLVARMFNVGLGLQWGECTTLNLLKMDWILDMPRSFKIRFVQGLADSDGGMKPYEVVITSIPNADFVTRLLRSLGMTTAHVVRESGKELRTMVNARQATALPIFNEFVRSYRYQRLMEYI